ncbi:hypothetical protein C8J57DRAFT_1712345 [Mycena rebaudengoi]|nr:hypothetical protein C8J57DRAFT_1712345 [Mycena rebaudengoi]
MTTSVILVSPGKPNHRIDTSLPTIRALNSSHLKTLPPDNNWEGDLYVNMGASGEEDIVCERDRPAERHAKLKTKVKIMDERFAALELALSNDQHKLEELLGRMDDYDNKIEELHRRMDDSDKRHEKQRIVNIQMLKGIIANLENTISTMLLVEEYEVVDATLRAFSDRIYDLRREPGLTYEEKQTLKMNGLRYILNLLDYIPEFEIGDPNATPIDQAFHTALGLLIKQEWDLCYHLQAHRKTLRDPRNTARYPRPDRSTAERWLTKIAPEHHATFTELLDSNPLRMMTSEDDDYSDLRIVVGDGEYAGPEGQQALLAQLRDTLEELQQEEAARVGDKRKNIGP